jgi:hypothetical protein
MRTRTKVLLAAATVLIPVVAFGLYWFQPWKLWTNDTVHDALPAVATQTAPAPAGQGAPAPAGQTTSATAGDTVLATGRFISHEHHTDGTASIIRLADGKRVLAIADLDTSEGPDVHVWLTDRTVTKGGWHVFDDGKHIDLGELKGNHGDLLYRIPDTADLSTIRSVSIWCARFDVSFGAAQLKPVS